jgi:nitrous oxide reductase accessory protein NosL
MTTKILVILTLALFISACESTSPDAQPTPSPAAQSAATPSSTALAETDHPAPSVAFKAGDKVKATINGSTVDATIVSFDDKAGKAVIKVAGETKERTVNLSEIVKQ